MVCCPLCVAPPLALACSALGIKQTPYIFYGASGAGGAAMLTAVRLGCGSKGTLRRLNMAGGAAMIAYAFGGFAYETVQQTRRAKEGCVAVGGGCGRV
jgi:hypothetical protein